MEKYTSSIVSKYGDTANVKADAQTLWEIIDRQGTALLIDAIAEYTGTAANKFNMSETDRLALIKSLQGELAEALSERL
jgi:hypothetical protein